MSYESGILRSENYQPPAKKKKPYGKGLTEHLTSHLIKTITDKMRLDFVLAVGADLEYMNSRKAIDAAIRASRAKI